MAAMHSTKPNSKGVGMNKPNNQVYCKTLVSLNCVWSAIAGINNKNGENNLII